MKIIGATATAVFSLASVFAGTYAWFSLNESVTATGMQVSVAVNGSAELTSLNLIKFDYYSERIGNFEVLDYLKPENGTVNEYYFNENYNDGAGAFGHDVDDNFVAVDTTMNVYDPVDRIIRGGNLSSLNCNAIYETTFASSINVAYLQLYANRLLDKVPSENQILLSSCIDFDVYFESDLEFCSNVYSDSKTYEVGDYTIYNSLIHRCSTAVETAESFDSTKWEELLSYSASSTYSVGDCVIYSGAIYTCASTVNTPESFAKSRWNVVETYSASSAYALGDFVIHNGHPYKCITVINSGESFNASKWEPLLVRKIYYPSYKTFSFSASEEIYYKLSYLSSLEASHRNFYSTNPHPETINLARDYEIEFSIPGEEHKVYVNVNYAPSQADIYIREIYNTIRAIYDFTLDFQFTESAEVDA